MCITPAKAGIFHVNNLPDLPNSPDLTDYDKEENNKILISKIC